MPLPTAVSDRLPLQEILGYLNFSSGTTDPKFLRNLSDLWQALESTQPADTPTWQTAHQLLSEKLESLAAANPTFKDATQARAILHLLFNELLFAYRRHHRDLLFHQTEALLWRPYFIGRAAEAILAEGAPWEETQRIVAGALARLNDFLGYRPVAVLETHRHEPYPHERVRPVPLYIAAAGVAAGKYHDLIQQTLSILHDADPDLLQSAWFDPKLLDELSLDPRAYDFNHPVNRRPNYHFGQWDPHHIDNQGRYRRFVIQQCTLDAVQNRIDTAADLPRDQLLFEGGAVLAGTILMASGTSGSGPESHDSSVSLATLLPQIARYRDEFYRRLIDKVGGPHQARLQAEAESKKQPFATARQHLNTELARLRALQMQHVQLALLFARLGFSDAAQRQAQIVPAVSARMVCQMQCLLTSGHRSADRRQLAEAFDMLSQVEDLLRRAIESGAVIDPWNILAFGGQFSLFPAVENSIPDPRVDELLDLIDQIFALYARLWYEAATTDDKTLLERLPGAFRALAQWWDKFATTTVQGIPQISGAEAHTAAARVAKALAAWRKAGEAAGNLAFWRPHAEHFDSPHAYSRVIEVLLDKPDLQAAMALLMQWLSHADRIALDEGRRSFFALAIRWLQIALTQTKLPGAGAAETALALKFFDYLEANADRYWEVPQLNSTNGANHDSPTKPDDTVNSGGNPRDDEDEDSGLFSAAYEDVVYRDSTADGTDADMLEGAGYSAVGDDEIDRQHQRLSGRLAFLATLATLWKTAALSHASSRQLFPLDIPSAWLTRATENRRRLLALAHSIQKQPVKTPSANFDALLEYDRQRVMREALLEKVVATVVATSEAELLLSALQKDPPAAETTKGSLNNAATLAIWRAVLSDDVEAVRSQCAHFLASVADRPLLYVPFSRGGDARKIAAARSLQQTFRELLRRLPRMGLLRETCQLLRAARVMEKNHPQGPGAVTEFDRLFEIGYKAIVETLVETSGRMNGSLCGQSDSTETCPADADPSHSDAPATEAQLIECLQQVTESLLNDWLSHSSTLRISVLERVSTPKAWQELVKFIQRYGHDLFTQQFFHLGNLRAIMHQGVDHWLDRLAEVDDAQPPLLITELDHGLSRADAKRHLALVIEAIVENYGEYRDYNATTTQSDRGEMLYTLLDFLRIKVGYERIHWNLRPVIMAHEVLVRRGCHGAAELWRRAMAQRTSEAADQQLARLAELQNQYGMRLPTIADRLSERFIRPLIIDRVRALVAPAAKESRQASSSSSFALLEQEASELAEEPCGAGLDLPDWLELLEQEVDQVSDSLRGFDNVIDDSPAQQPLHPLTWDEIQSQLTDWDLPTEPGT